MHSNILKGVNRSKRSMESNQGNRIEFQDLGYLTSNSDLTGIFILNIYISAINLNSKSSISGPLTFYFILRFDSLYHSPSHG